MEALNIVGEVSKFVVGVEPMSESVSQSNELFERWKGVKDRILNQELAKVWGVGYLGVSSMTGVQLAAYVGEVACLGMGGLRIAGVDIPFSGGDLAGLYLTLLTVRTLAVGGNRLFYQKAWEDASRISE